MGNNVKRLVATITKHIIADGGIYITPTSICPKCGGMMLSDVDLIFIPDGVNKGLPRYELDLAEEIQGLHMSCLVCKHEANVSGADLIYDNEDVVEYR